MGLRVDKHSPNEARKAPVIQIGLNPNLFTNPPIMGPHKDMIPVEIELTSDTENLSELKYLINGPRSTPPNVNPKPSVKIEKKS